MAQLAEDAQAVPNYKELIYSTVKSSFIDPSSVGQVEISPLHPARPPQMGDWMAGVRISIKGQPTLYAAFIEGQPPRVLQLRLGVRVDDCHQDQYEPFPGSPPAEIRPPLPCGRPANEPTLGLRRDSSAPTTLPNLDNSRRDYATGSISIL
jgi:hypothetical protein